MKEVEYRYKRCEIEIHHQQLGKLMLDGLIMQIDADCQEVWHPLNTVVKVHKDVCFNHIEHVAGGKKFAILYNEGSVQLFDDLVEMGFPYHYEPVPDDATIEWFISLSKDIGEIAIKEFLRIEDLEDDD